MEDLSTHMASKATREELAGESGKSGTNQVLKVWCMSQKSQLTKRNGILQARDIKRIGTSLDRSVKADLGFRSKRK